MCLLVELIGDEMLGAHDSEIGATETIAICAISLILIFTLLLSNKQKNHSFLREIVLISILASISAILRIIFSTIPNLQPVTILVLIFGIKLGARRGSAIAILVALLSNIHLGTGLWTIFQATGWIIVACSGALFKSWLIDNKSNLHIGKLASLGFVFGFVFDWWVSLSALQSLNGIQEFLAYLLVGIPFDLIHGFGNVVFAIWLAKPITNLLEKYSGLEDNSDSKNTVEAPNIVLG